MKTRSAPSGSRSGRPVILQSRGPKQTRPHLYLTEKLRSPRRGNTRRHDDRTCGIARAPTASPPPRTRATPSLLKPGSPASEIVTILTIRSTIDVYSTYIWTQLTLSNESNVLICRRSCALATAAAISRDATTRDPRPAAAAQASK